MVISSLWASSPFCPASLGSPVLSPAPHLQGQLAHWARREGPGPDPARWNSWGGWRRWGVLQLELKTAHCFLRLAETEKTRRLGDPMAQTCNQVSLTYRTVMLPPRNVSLHFQGAICKWHNQRFEADTSLLISDISPPPKHGMASFDISQLKGILVN